MRQHVLTAMLIATSIVCVGCKEKALVPVGALIQHPILINYTCSAVFASEDKVTEDKNGKILKDMECPSGSDAPPYKLLLIETTEGELLWIDEKDVNS